MTDAFAAVREEIHQLRAAHARRAMRREDAGVDATLPWGRVDALDALLGLMNTDPRFTDVTDPEPGKAPRLPLPVGAEFEALYAPGRRVRFAHTDCGWPGEADTATAHLTLGEVYTIAWSDIGFAKSRLGLEGVTGDGGQGFNSVFFEPVPDGDLTEDEESP
jgi:hypothetical protein